MRATPVGPPHNTGPASLMERGCWGSATVMSKGALIAISPRMLLSLQLLASVAFPWVAGP